MLHVSGLQAARQDAQPPSIQLTLLECIAKLFLFAFNVVFNRTPRPGHYGARDITKRNHLSKPPQWRTFLIQIALTCLRAESWLGTDRIPALDTSQFGFPEASAVARIQVSLFSRPASHSSTLGHFANVKWYQTPSSPTGWADETNLSGKWCLPLDLFAWPGLHCTLTILYPSQSRPGQLWPHQPRRGFLFFAHFFHRHVMARKQAHLGSHNEPTF